MKLRLSLLCIGLAGLLGCGSSRHLSPNPGVEDVKPRIPCQVMFVMDGDTISCDINGNGRIEKPTEHIRLLGIDAPETKNSAKARRRQHAEQAVDEPYAQAAKQWLRSRVQRQTVWLRWDVNHEDRYGRSLAWVYAQPSGGVSLNEQLVADGLATTLYLGVNRWHEAEMEVVVKKAHDDKRGIWAPEGEL